MSLMPSESWSFPDNFRAALRPALAVLEKQNISPLPPAASKLVWKAVPVESSKPPLPPVESESVRKAVPIESSKPALPPMESEPVQKVDPVEPSKPALPPVESEPVRKADPVEPSKFKVVPRAKVRFSKAQSLEASKNGGADHPSFQSIPANDQKQEQEIAACAMVRSEEPTRLNAASTGEVQPEPNPLLVRPFPLSPPSFPSRRPGSKLFRFLLCEALAISALVALAMLGISHRITDQTLALLINILIIAAAAAVATIPIILFGRGETVPRRERQRFDSAG
jgi:hypothetical protein